MTSEERDRRTEVLPEEELPEEERPRRIKSEDEMSKGKNYRLEEPDAVFEFDPSKRSGLEEGGEPQ